MKHIQGPWEIQPATVFGRENTFGVAIGNKKERGQFAFVFTFLSDDGIEKLPFAQGEANAKLIAAAPLLLEALKQLLYEFEQINGNDTQSLRAITNSKDAIKQATE